MGQESYYLGKKGEEFACQYLTREGFNVIERNFRSHQGEIDIITKDKNCLVFVEVKYYSYRSFFPPIYAIRKSKKESLLHTAKLYLYKKNLYDKQCRFDVIALYHQLSGKMVIDHIKNAFRLDGY